MTCLSCGKANKLDSVMITTAAATHIQVQCYLWVRNTVW